MAAISKPLLPPKRGYIERENPITGERYYAKVETPIGYSTETIIVRESQPFEVPVSKDQIFQIKLIGGGASYEDSINGADGNIEIKELVLEEGKDIYISIGPAGVNGSNGGTTSFGDFFYALGGVSRQEIALALIHNENYGKGGTETSDATDGVCIITHQAPVYS